VAPGLSGGPLSDWTAVDRLETAAELLSRSRRTLVFTGAGVSTESGIPDFRGPQGVWRTRDPALWTIERYRADPEVRRERWLERLRSPVDSARPNAAHHAIVALERLGTAPVVVTQNIDGLHQVAGSSDVIELHGTTRAVLCLGCDRRLPVEPVLDRVREGDLDPHCESCGGLLKMATVSFGQALDEADVERAMREAELCDLCLAVGSTLSVWPAAGVPLQAVRCGARLVIVNRGATDLDATADALLDGAAGEILPALVRQLRPDVVPVVPPAG
jgi:NAD-dependent deacetylase